MTERQLKLDFDKNRCQCGLHWELCSALSFLEIMCTAATRGEVANAQHAAARFLEILR